MPGIAGIHAPRACIEHKHTVMRMIDAMRGDRHQPSGTLFAPEAGVHAAWVAHKDSAAAQTSSRGPCGSVQLLLAGECFVPPHHRQDTLVDAYAAAGDGFTSKLNGLFAGLLVDRARRRALLFNDRYANERLYVHEQGGVTYFASEAKALLRVLPQLRAFDDIGVAQYLSFGCTLGGRTLFRGLSHVPGASLCRFTADAPAVWSRYFDAGEWESQSPLDRDDWEARFQETFRRIVLRHARAHRPNEPVGLSITGGLDTRMILAALPRSEQPALAYTYAADGSDTLDVKIGRRVAASRDMPHHALRVGADFIHSYGIELDRTVFVTDGCAGALGAHELFLARQAKALAPVRLTGNFGSEILRGMSTFKPIGLDQRLFDAALRPAIDRVTQERAARTAHPITHAAFEEIPWHIHGAPAAARSQLMVRTPFLDNEVVALAYRAPPALRRIPASALRLVHACDPTLAVIPTDRGLAWGVGRIREGARRLYCASTFKLDYWHKEGLPQSLARFDPLVGSMSHVGLLHLHKYLPYRRWFRCELAAYLRQVIDDEATRGMAFWDRRFLKRLVADHVDGKRNHLREIAAVLSLEAVQRMLIRDAAHPAHAAQAPLTFIETAT